MTWSAGHMYSAETDDYDAYALSAINGTVSVARSALFVKTGSASLAFDLTGANKAILDTRLATATARINALSFTLAASGSPSADASFVYGTPSATPVADDNCYVCVNTSRQLEIRDKSGAVWATSNTLVPTAGDPVQFCVIFDGLTGGTVRVFLYAAGHMEAGADSQLAWADFFDTGDRLYFGDYRSATAGVTLYADDLCARVSTSAGDSPELTQYPVIRVNGCVNPDANGNSFQWTVDGATDYTPIDNSELPTNDGDTSYVSSITNSQKFLVKSSDANPIPSGKTILHMQGPVVMKNNNGGKITPSYLVRTGGSEGSTSLAAVTTAYLGDAAVNIAKPGGGAWAQSDFDASTTEWGLIHASSGDVGSRVTLMLGPEIAYQDALLPLAQVALPVRTGGLMGMSPGIF